MRCPKCHYLSFDPEPRCRNCGYDLEVADSDLALKTAEPDHGPMPDLTLRERPPASTTPLALELVHTDAAPIRDEYDQRTDYDDALDADEVPTRVPQVLQVPPVLQVLPVQEPAAPVAPVTLADPEAPEEPEAPEAPEEPEGPEEPVALVAPAPRLSLVEERPPLRGSFGRTVSAPAATPPEPPRTPFRSQHTTTTELPLFVKGIADREELLEETSAPVIVPPARPPLAVRRTVTEPAPRAAASDRRLGPFDHDLLEDLKRVEREEAARHREESRAAAVAMELSAEPVEPSRRVLAAVVDTAVLGSIAGFVFWATLRLCGVGVSDLGAAALIPLVGFIAVVVIAYLFMFTAAGGQTVGKMWMGLRVVADEAHAGEPLSVRQATWRAALSVVSVVSLGVGWVPALFGRGITLHDRLAHTRVVRA